METVTEVKKKIYFKFKLLLANNATQNFASGGQLITLSDGSQAILLNSSADQTATQQQCNYFF